MSHTVSFLYVIRFHPQNDTNSPCWIREETFRRGLAVRNKPKRLGLRAFSTVSNVPDLWLSAWCGPSLQGKLNQSLYVVISKLWKHAIKWIYICLSVSFNKGLVLLVPYTCHCCQDGCWVVETGDCTYSLCVCNSGASVAEYTTRYIPVKKGGHCLNKPSLYNSVICCPWSKLNANGVKASYISLQMVRRRTNSNSSSCGFCKFLISTASFKWNGLYGQRMTFRFVWVVWCVHICVRVRLFVCVCFSGGWCGNPPVFVSACLSMGPVNMLGHLPVCLDRWST